MINLCLVVIATQFSETKRRETAKMKAERARFQSSSTLSSFTNSETTNCYRQIIKLIAHFLRRGFQKSRKAYKAMRTRRLAKKEQQLMEQKGAGKLQNYNVMKNVSTHSIINAPDGKLTLKYLINVHIRLAIILNWPQMASNCQKTKWPQMTSNDIKKL